MALRHEPVVADGRPARRPPSVERVSHRDRETRSTLCRCVTHWRSDGTTPRGRCGSTREPADRPPPLLDAVLSDFLAASLRRPNYDPPISAIYAFPRPLLAPPPPNTCRSSIVSILRGRITQLANGGAQALWASHPWLQTLPAAIDFSATCPARAAARMSSVAAVKSPSAVYRSLSTPAFLPHPRRIPEISSSVFSLGNTTPTSIPPSPTPFPAPPTSTYPGRPFPPASSTTPPSARASSPSGLAISPPTRPASRTAPAFGAPSSPSVRLLPPSPLPMASAALPPPHHRRPPPPPRLQDSQRMARSSPRQADQKAATRPPGGRHDIGCPPQAFLVGEDRA